MGRKKSLLNRRSASEKIIYALAFIFMMTLCIYIIYYFYFALQLATKENAREYTAHFMENKLGTWSKSLNFKNFIESFKVLKVKEYGYFGLVANSLIYSFGSIIPSLFFQACTTYVVCKYKFIGRNFYYNMMIVTMMIPIYGAMPSAIRAYKMIGIYDNWGILLTACGGFNLIMYSFWKGISWEYAEAAFIDGAGHFQVFIQIMLPMVLPSISVFFITGFIGHWNEYLAISLYMPNLPTLAYGLYIYEQEMFYRANQPIYFAGVLLASLPCFLLFFIFQNSIMTKVYIGGLKG